jgi:hypothetical protein
MLWRNISPPPSGSRSKPSRNKLNLNLLAASAGFLPGILFISEEASDCYGLVTVDTGFGMIRKHHPQHFL